MNYDDLIDILYREWDEKGDDLSLKDIDEGISNFSVDKVKGGAVSPFTGNADTILYSGDVNGYRASNIVKELDDVRIIDNSAVGKFLSNYEDNELFGYISQAIEHDIKHNLFSPEDYGLSASDIESIKQGGI